MLYLNVTSALLPRTYAFLEVPRPPRVQTCSEGVAVVCPLHFTSFRAISINIGISFYEHIQIPSSNYENIKC